jgi:hypothetical protein
MLVSNGWQSLSRGSAVLHVFDEKSVGKLGEVPDGLNGNPEVIFEPDLAYAVGWKDGRKQCWGHRGDKKKVFGDGPGAVN